MSFITDLLTGGLENIINPISKVIDQFHVSDEEKEKLRIQVKKQMTEVFQEVEKTHRQEIESKANIIQAEMAQGDNFTKRARPAVVYWGMALITLCNFFVPFLVLVVRLFNGEPISDLPTIPLDESVYWAWTSVVGVWTAGRSAEKLGVRNKIVSSIVGK